ncbi:hypothetical protein LZP73_16550 [Shewanella sp. AS16]|uniref:hypothetical protein n=1 Tax=Shewanella sp. AS16 TaxID=2907625 RepID=UPI001F175903|nr:hypothetical protein [Shewanella sp. AS16]MCE9687792.1 hypothetical protein [Shewanella sp. AS16]
MKRFNCNRLTRALGVTLISSAFLYGATSLTPANASFFPQKMDQACMAEQAGFNLNCTANDVRVSKVDNIKNIDNPGDPVECVLGSEVTFLADVTITTTANERYDYSVYLPEGSWSAQDSNPDNTCSILLGQTDGPGVDLEEGLDACADISKAAGFNPTHLYEAEEITLFCRDDDNSGKAEFNYCMAWHNKTGADCSQDDPAAPGTPSKCRCDSFDIDVFIKPNPPTVVKTLIGTNTHTEPGGEYTYSVSFTNPNTKTALYLTSLSDVIDTGADGSYETTFDLWGATGSAGSTDGLYLTASNCTKPANGGEIAPSGSYSCQFTVHIVDTDLPDDQSPELYNDLIKLSLEDKNGSPVTDGNTCAAVGGVDGDHCSNVIQVQVTNLPPTISVLKSASPDQVPESGDTVTYTVRVDNTSDTWDSPLLLTSLMDDKFGDLNGKGTCATGGYIAYNDFYECSFDEFISGSGAGSHTNIATAKAVDNEADEATNSDSETVVINDVPSMIDLIKTANPTSVLETGDDPAVTRAVDYTFEFSVDAAGVDKVTFSSLTDTIFGDITGDCMVDMLNGAPIAPTPLNGFMLLPGEYASCTITEQLKGNAGDVHVNLATIDGVDEDGQPVQDMDDATVTFIPGSPATDMKFAASMLVVLELHNAGIENVNLTLMTVAGVSVFGGADVPGFRLINGGGDFDGVGYAGCVDGQELGYNGSGTDTYSCAFTIEFKPGLENTDPINFLNDVIVRVEDDEGDDSTNDVSIEVHTIE